MSQPFDHVEYELTNRVSWVEWGRGCPPVHTVVVDMVQHWLHTAHICKLWQACYGFLKKGFAADDTSLMCMDAESNTYACLWLLLWHLWQQEPFICPVLACCAGPCLQPS